MNMAPGASPAIPETTMKLMRNVLEDAIEAALLGTFLVGIACLARSWSGF